MKQLLFDRNIIFERCRTLSEKFSADSSKLHKLARRTTFLLVWKIHTFVIVFTLWANNLWHFHKPKWQGCKLAVFVFSGTCCGKSSLVEKVRKSSSVLDSEQIKPQQVCEKYILGDQSNILKKNIFVIRNFLSQFPASSGKPWGRLSNLLPKCRGEHYKVKPIFWKDHSLRFFYLEWMTLRKLEDRILGVQKNVIGISVKSQILIIFFGVWANLLREFWKKLAAGFSELISKCPEELFDSSFLRKFNLFLSILDSER